MIPVGALDGTFTTADRVDFIFFPKGRIVSSATAIATEAEIVCLFTLNICALTHKDIIAIG
jgi:hypothetical protein